MQKLVHLLFIVCAIIGSFAVTSCGNDDDADITPQEKITGKWTMKTSIGNYTIQGDNRQETTTFTASDYFDFKADGTITIVEGNNTYTGKWQITGNRLFITETGYLDSYRNGFDLAKLTNTELQLFHSETNSFSTTEQTLNLSK